MHVTKLGDRLLFATVGMLAVVWLFAVVGLSLTVKREYRLTFVSLQTGCASAQAYFLDNEGNDGQRIWVFFCNERQWRAIRERVRHWVLSVYATWNSLMPAWFTPDLHARIPDDFMPAQVVQHLNAQAPDGRRPTLQGMGLLRRASVVSTEGSADLDGGGLRAQARPIGKHGQNSSRQPAEDSHVDAEARPVPSLDRCVSTQAGTSPSGWFVS